ncbi:MAG: hypothetical protein IH845_02930 [Nanoarchaeota archaeon]|nr:hypothetical protein [Nanoarchaeota archaeon]
MVKKGNDSFVLGFAFVLVASLLFVLSVVIAAHVILPASFSVNESVNSLYNISVDNTDINFTANISEVTITIPSNFTFLASSNDTDAGTHTFTNTSTVLNWSKDGLVMNETLNYFWFNATVITPGSYNLTVNTTNTTGTYSTDISVTVNDTTAPSTIDFVSPTEDDNSNLSRNYILVNVTATDNGVIDTIIIRLFDSNHTQINSSSNSSSPNYVNFTGLNDGVYYFNATVNDTTGNSNNTATRNVTVDTITPIVTLISPANATSSTTDSYNFTFNVTDDRDVSNCSLILDDTVINSLFNVNNTGGTLGIQGSSLSVATHTWSVNCTDASGNIGNSSEREFTVTAAAATTPSPGSSSPAGYTSYYPSETKLSNGYSVTLAKNTRVNFDLAEESHVLTLESFSFSDSSAVIKVSSDPVTFELKGGEVKKLDLSHDGFYDLNVLLKEVKLNSVVIVMTSINEEVESVPTNESGAQDSEPGSEDTTESVEKSNLKLIVFLIILAVLVIGIAVYFVKFKKE